MTEQCFECENVHDTTCKRCGVFFCREHGHLEEEVCNTCLEIEGEGELI